jgi:hypothetical protein
VIVGDQLGDVADGVDEVERGGAAVGVRDRRALLLIRITVKREQLMALLDPCGSVVDRTARDVDREVIARIGS